MAEDMRNSHVYHQVQRNLEQFIATSPGLCVALSGGVDSVVLLHLCKLYADKHGLALQAVYVNHGLSEHAQKWQHFCQSLCHSLAVPFTAKSVFITQKSRTSLEAQARDARYQALDEAAQPEYILVLGQHADDQVETFLLRLKRGSGLLGLGAMKPYTQLKSGRACMRPLLNTTRDEIEAFAQQFGLSHIDDESNKDDVFDRNFLRNQVIPLLKSRFNGFVASVLRTVEILQSQQAIIDEISAEDLKKCQHQNTLDITSLSQLSPARRDNVIRRWLAHQNVDMPSQKQLDQIVQQAFSAKQDNQLKIALSQGAVRSYRGALHWVTPVKKKQDIVIADHSVLNEHSHPLAMMSGNGCRLPLSDEVVSVRYGRLKDKIRPKGKPGSNTLKHWLKDLRIPSWTRESIAVIYYNDTPVAVVDLFVNAEYADNDGINWIINDDRKSENR